MDDKNKSIEWPDDNEVIYVSDETYRGIYRAIDHMEQAQKELRKAAETQGVGMENIRARVASFGGAMER